MTIDLARLLGLTNLSEAKVDVVERNYVKPAVSELSASQPAAELVAFLISARMIANAGVANAAPGAYGLASARLSSARLTSAFPGATQTALAALTANMSTGAISDLARSAGSPAITQATPTMITAGSPAHVAEGATTPAVGEAAPAQRALQRTAVAPATAMPAVAAISSSRPALVARSAQVAGKTLAVATPSEMQLSTARYRT
jgi:hypothetical protein